MSTRTPHDAVVVGGGVAGLSAAVFTARQLLGLLGERFAEPHPDDQETHPSLVDD